MKIYHLSLLALLGFTFTSCVLTPEWKRLQALKAQQLLVQGVLSEKTVKYLEARGIHDLKSQKVSDLKALVRQRQEELRAAQQSEEDDDTLRELQAALQKKQQQAAEQATPVPSTPQRRGAL